jgi:hypothetical protein
MATMQDRPTSDELLAAVEHFLDTEIVPKVPGARGFHARVAANAVRIVRRELALEEEHAAREWAGLDALLGRQPPPEGRYALREELRARNAALCERIRSGEADSGVPAQQVFSHVRATLRDKLAVSNPALLARDEPQG